MRTQASTARETVYTEFFLTTPGNIPRTVGEETSRAIRAVAGGEAIFSATIAQRLVRYFSEPRRIPGAESQLFPELTDREHDILTLMAQGYTNIAIADRLYLSPKTVRNYVSNIFIKLQVADRTEAIICAREAGLGQEYQP